MSKALDQSAINFVNALPPSLKVLEEAFQKPYFSLPEGSDNYTLLQANTVSFSSSGTSYTAQMSPGTLMHPVMIEEIDFTVSITFTNNGTSGTSTSPFKLQNRIAPRFMPISSASVSSIFQVNGVSLGTGLQEGETIHPLMSFNKSPLMDDTQLNAYTPMLDNYCGNYTPNFAQTAVSSSTLFNYEDSLRSPFASFADKTHGVNPRFSGVDLLTWDTSEFTLAVGTPVTRTFRFKCRQPIVDGLHKFVEGESSAFANITNNWTFTRTFSANLAKRLISLAVPLPNVADNWGTGSNVSYTITGGLTPNEKPILYYGVITKPKHLEISFDTYYPYVDFMNLISTNPTTVIGSKATIQSQAITISTIPKFILVWAVRKLIGNKEAWESDASPFAIERLSLNIYNQSGQYSSASEIQLYNTFCGPKGFYASYNEAYGKVSNPQGGVTPVHVNTPGSIFLISTDQMAGIDWKEYSVASQYPTNLIISADIRSIDGVENGTAILNVMLVGDSIVRISADASAAFYRGFMTPDQVRQVREQADMVQLQNPRMGGSMELGGGFWGDLWSKAKDIGKKVGQYAWDHKADIAQAGLKALTGLGRHVKHAAKGRRRHPLKGGAYLDDVDEYDEDDHDQSQRQSQGQHVRFV